MDPETGEIGQQLLEGSLVLTPEDQERQQKEKERIREAAKMRSEKELNRHRNRNERFYFVAADNSLDLQPIDAARLIFLSTYVGYDSDQLFSGYKDRRMKKSDLPKILEVSPDTSERFWKAVSPMYITEDPEGYLHVNKDWICRGRLKEFKQYQQFYDGAIRKLYRTATSGSKKRIGYVFNMLPWINREWNVLSENPHEEDLNAVQPLSVSEFCMITGLDPSNIQRTLRQFQSIRFQTDRGLERFCSVVDNGAEIVINPSVLYVGSNINRVKVFDLFFRDIK